MVLPFPQSSFSPPDYSQSQVKLNPRYPKYRWAYAKVKGMKGVVIGFTSGTMINADSKSLGKTANLF